MNKGLIISFPMFLIFLFFAINGMIKSNAKQEQLRCEIKFLDNVPTWTKEDWDTIFKILHSENIPTVTELIKKRCTYWISNGQKF